MTEERKRRVNTPDLARQIVRWYAASPGQVLHYGDCADALHQPRENVNTSLGRLVKLHPEYGLERVGGRGGMFVYRPDKVNSHAQLAVIPAEPAEPKPGDLVEIVGQLDGGEYVGRLPGESRLWKMVRL